MKLNILDFLFILCVLSIWIMLFYNAILTLYGYKYFVEVSEKSLAPIKNMNYFPKVSILIPAHNEEKVIEKTVKSMFKLDYPSEHLEIIVINDNSSDNTASVLKTLQDDNPSKNLIVINTDKNTGGRGKSGALNIGYKKSTGEYLVIYDADNTPEPLALRHLVYTIISNNEYGAVIGKFRTRNKKNLLTKFINIEGLSFQWMAQGGRWKLFKLCTIPGTNFIIRRSIIDEIKGWDPNAIAEDTEISIRIYRMGYKICFMPLAVTWEQEPETIKVWLKQRTRWVQGNVYVLFKYLSFPFRGGKSKILIDIYYFFSVYFLFLVSVLLSDLIFVLGLFTNYKVSISGNFMILWILSYLMFILEVSISLTMEKGEFTKENFFIIALMYFTYCQMWIVVSIKGFYMYIKNTLLKKQHTWYKTERF
ncbi:glycosyltransferase [Clostridium hydrogeniformans]|uniref:glycosyltransferase n=1 Tax=Clostridium hydrogeniformans TaxID=349933 RepID=UPI00048159EE|nr:glycosyltransferase [Clostridium hydrogeniformans]